MATEAEVLAAGPGPTPCSGAPSTGMKITDLLKMDLPLFEVSDKVRCPYSTWLTQRGLLDETINDFMIKMISKAIHDFAALQGLVQTTTRPTNRASRA